MLFTSEQRRHYAKTLWLKHQLSQNFLLDDHYLKQIAEAATPTLPDSTLVEIGAGAGFLTDYLAQIGVPLTAIEVDPTMVHFLQPQLEALSHVTLLQHDVRTLDLTTYVTPTGVLVGNLPYHLTGPLLFQITGELTDTTHPLRQRLEKAVIMIQKEVGDRLLAKPGDTAYSQLTLQASFWFDIHSVAHVPKTAFAPQPKVDSAVVALTPRQGPAITVGNLQHLQRVIKAAFQHRRKTLLNSLKIAGFGNSADLPAVLEALGIAGNARPQNISIEQFGALSDALFP